MTPVKIGNLELKQNRPVFLAPMAGVTDLPFRLLCKEQGCDDVYGDDQCQGSSL